MIDKAIAKITEEMMAINHPFAVYIEEYLTGICTSDAVAEKLLNPKKTLKEFVNKTIAEMMASAQKRGYGAQAAGASDQEFYEKAEAYFEITDEDKQGRVRPSAKQPAVIDITAFL